MDLYTPRLRLEPLETRHAAELFAGLQATEIYDFIADIPPRDIDTLRERYATLALRRSPDGTEQWLNWAVWSLPEQRYIGYLQATIDPRKIATLAYVLFPDAWGRGYAREAVARIIDHLFQTIDGLDVRAHVDVRNRRSIALLERLGFVRIAVHPDAQVIHGRSADEAEYRLTADLGSSSPTDPSTPQSPI